MNFTESVFVYLIPFFLALGYFSPSLNNSRGGVKLKAGVSMKVSLLFSLISVLMLLAGYSLAGLVKERTVGPDNWIAMIFLFLIGFRMIISGWKKKASQMVFDIEKTPVAMGMATALSVNSFFGGVVVSFMGLAVWKVVSALAILVWFITFSGLLQGNQFSENYGRASEYIAGIGLIILTIVYYL